MNNWIRRLLRRIGLLKPIIITHEEFNKMLDTYLRDNSESICNNIIKHNSLLNKLKNN